MLVFSAGRLGVTGTSMPGGKMDQILSISFGISIFMIAFVVFSAIFDGRLYTLKRAVKIIILGICVFAVFMRRCLRGHILMQRIITWNYSGLINWQLPETANWRRKLY